MRTGRPTRFNDALKEKMADLYEKGATDVEVAKAVGVSPRSIATWKARHPDFLQALKESKQIADDLVEASLFLKATGYSHKEEKIFQYEGQIVTYETTKHYPPDTIAGIFWLKNRQPDNWREEKENINVNIQLADKISKARARAQKK